MRMVRQLSRFRTGVTGRSVGGVWMPVIAVAFGLLVIILSQNQNQNWSQMQQWHSGCCNPVRHLLT